MPLSQQRGLKFWLIMAALSVSGLLTAMESTVVSTALAHITAELGGREKYIWELRNQVMAAFTDVLKRTWQVGIALAGVGVLLVLFEVQVELR
ncbi:hypothetical protein P168DRAFT_318172 [Aspergillus campestris IBT 28561]|uniref:CNNM transmembrane domain-containing protein n=1 Tax=Aspergillus campestris (strain IBT 28561) TaxID=1392248 RepID=A0A2I1D5J1_ASPC2|nr:uncharacterized protein P168DRAFT_318172 [Aspergillus campestris IBT 28561]PKY05144.1 hypothetical protein P168DRAFT_318172 [Aspergillus campestris IBT 28561]